MMEWKVNELGKLIQVFLTQGASSGPSIYEVSSKSNGELVCTCPTFGSKKSCKHSRLVEDRIESNDGAYPLEIGPSATDEEILESQESHEALRSFIIKHGHIQVY